MELACVLVADVTNPDVGDLMVDTDGHEVVLTSMPDEVQQRLTVRFNFFRQEWFLDANEGTPYYEHILVKAPGDRAIRTVFSSVIRGTEGVAQLNGLGYNISKTRHLTLNFSVQCVDGSTVKLTNFPAFLVDGTDLR